MTTNRLQAALARVSATLCKPMSRAETQQAIAQAKNLVYRYLTDSTARQIEQGYNQHVR